MNIRSALLSGLALAAVAAPSHAALFADVETVDAGAEVATGSLNGVDFTLLSTRAAPRPFSGDNGGIVGAVIDSSSTFFDAAEFTPSLPLGDALFLGSASDYKLTFAQPVSDLVLHIRQLQANRFSFTPDGGPRAFSLLSSDGDFTVSNANTAIQGTPSSADDANGSLLFAGTLTELSWTSAAGIGANANSPEDGIALQISVVPEPSSTSMLAAALIVLLARMRRRSPAAVATALASAD